MKKIIFLPFMCCSFLTTNCSNAKEIKVMSFNIQHGIDYKHKKEKKEEIVNLDPVIEIVKKYNPDVVNFNEIYGKHTQFGNQVEYIANHLNYHAYFVHAADISKDKNYYGGAILSRFSFSDVCTHKIPKPASAGENFEPRAIGEVTININSNQKVKILESHFGLSDEEYDLTLQTLTPLIKEKEKTLFMGDLNLSPNSPYIKQIEQYMDEVVDVNVPTFPSINPDRHIDYIFKSHDLVTTSSSVLEDIYSDHRPVIATIKL